jgi:hypothetical protein
MTFNAKVETMNSGQEFQNVNVVLVNGEKKNLKLTFEQSRQIELGKTYHFEVESYIANEKEQFKVISFEGIFEHIKDPVLLKEELKIQSSKPSQKPFIRIIAMPFICILLR